MISAAKVYSLTENRWHAIEENKGGLDVSTSGTQESHVQNVDSDRKKQELWTKIVAV